MKKLIIKIDNKEELLDIKENKTLIFGNKDICNFKIDVQSKKLSFFQIKIFPPLLFLINKYQIKTYYQELKIITKYNEIYISLEKNEKWSDKINIDDNTIIKIFNSQQFSKIVEKVQENIISRRQNSYSDMNPIEIMQNICAVADDIYWNNKSPCPSDDKFDEFNQITWCLHSQIFEYGVLTKVMHDKSITEIMINDHNNIYFEKDGKLFKSALNFQNIDKMEAFLERIVASTGKRLDKRQPFCDAVLDDGSRIHAILPPLTKNEPVINIRKFSKTMWHPDHLIKSKSCSKRQIELLESLIKDKMNILISGGTSTGKTTLINCLCNFISDEERIITIEDCTELKIHKPHIISLEAQPQNFEEKCEITSKILLKNALRMRPDRIIVGECRGDETFDMIQAMNTGHNGCLSTVHANSARDALFRIQSLFLVAAPFIPEASAKQQIISAIQIVVHLSKDKTGKRYLEGIYKTDNSESEIKNFFIRKLA